MKPELGGINPKVIKEHVLEGARKILDYSIAKQESFSGDNQLKAWLYQYIFLNIVLARPSFSVVCTWERKEQLQQMGLEEPGMIGLIAAQAVADHIAPNFLIAGILTAMHQATDISTPVALTASWILGRVSWGVICGITHASTYALTDRIGSLKSIDELSGRVNEAMMNIHVQNEIDHKFSTASF